jgi:DNA-binding transcriptional LysR family regulator
MERFTALETFVRVVDLGSYTAAARQLGISQSGASKAITRLEADLGVRLLHRSTRNVNTTDAGLRLHTEAKEALARIDDALRALREEAGSLTGKVRVAAPPGFARQYVVSALPQFLEQHPGMEVEMVMDDDIGDTAEARIDICFRHGEPHRKISGSRRIGTARRLVVGSPHYLARHGTPSDPADLAGHQAVVGPREKPSNVWWFTHADEVRRVELKGRLSVGSREALRESLLAHAGLAVVSEWDVAAELDAGALVAVLPEWSLPVDEIWAVASGGRLSGPAARAFINFVESSIPRR